MAIVDGRRIPDLTFHKAIGRKEWIAYHYEDGEWSRLGAVVETDTDEDPRTLRFHYCSPVSQPVFLDWCTSNSPYSGGLTSSSWKKLPEGWRNAFRDALRRCGMIKEGASDAR